LEPAQRLQLALQQLDRTLGFFPRVEGKASFLFAINLSLVGTAFAVVTWKSAESNLLIAVLLGLVAVLCAMSLTFLYFAYSPHLAPAQKRSLFYFQDIEGVGADKFAEKWRTISDDDVLGTV